ncbi:helix-turn-helix domain-containing protein [Erythrobacter vulgaris]|uniref:Helix-turn-helix domain-containing protein n=1 Tax=Qipengyuania vulgaris TaxID=291985 RepID=A0A844XVT3_9SPHN|nr:helix-turn-helix domain-containing protein [Qipengyuania vulgaris]MXO49223.1 helix-turn-helix domain-containing protein [Qipengyuania vulgaris]
MSYLREVTDVKPVLCSVTDAARCLGIGKTKAYDLISEGLLETISIGSRRLVKVASIHRLVEAPNIGEAA